MKQPVHFQVTDYGFEWGPMSIERHMSGDGWVDFELKTARVRLEIYVTATGMVRIIVPQGQSVTVIGGRKRKPNYGEAKP